MTPQAAADEVRLARSNLQPIVWGQAISMFGDYIAYVALPLFVVQLTGSALDLGLTTASETLPMLLFGFVAGVWLDRANIRRSLVFADLTRAAAFAVLALAAAADVAAPWMVFATAFVVGAMSSLFDSGLQAYMPGVLTEDLLVHVNARLQLVRTLAWTLGAAAGGLLIEFAGAAIAFAIDGATFLVSAGLLLMVRPMTARTPAARAGIIASIMEGLRFLWADARLRFATLGGALANLIFAPLEITLALFGIEQLGLSESGVGWLYAIQALIGAVGAAVAPRVAKRLMLGRMFVIGLVLMSAGFGITSQATSFIAVIPIGIALVGVSWLNVAVATLRQRLTPPDMLGRVVAASRTVTWSGIPAGAALGGLIGERIGLEPLYMGSSLLVLMVAVALVITALWREPVAATS